MNNRKIDYFSNYEEWLRHLDELRLYSLPLSRLLSKKLITQGNSSKFKVKITESETGKSGDCYIRTPDRERILFFVFLALKLVYLISTTFIPARRLKKDIQYNLIYSLAKDQIWRDGKLQSLNDFLIEQRFGMSKPNDFFVVESKKFLHRNCFDNQISVTYQISLYLFRRMFSLKKRLGILLDCWKAFLEFLPLYKTHPEIVLIAFEFIVEEPILRQVMSENRVSRLVTTQSQLFMQPLIFEMKENQEYPTREMFWYSLNSIHLAKSDDKEIDLPDESYYRLLPIDKHLVWSKDHALHLAKIGGLVAEAVGSILFCPKPVSYFSSNISSKFILIFDSTPYVTTEPDHLYSSENISIFLEEVVNCIFQWSSAKQIAIQVRLKPKRKLRRDQQTPYLLKIKELVSQNLISLQPHDSNLYNLVHESDAIIALPCTSPAFIGLELNKPTCFYSSAQNYEFPRTLHGVPILHSKSQLLKFLNSSLL